jgi:hypothetical protein
LVADAAEAVLVDALRGIVFAAGTDVVDRTFSTLFDGLTFFELFAVAELDVAAATKLLFERFEESFLGFSYARVSEGI